ncbi:hypothetical protein V12B01_04113 [Vibrio splendidus 12B01]|nr:hypothetical protein V12B01_04113 [Vibrio splendidus 12B01]
MKNEEKRKTLDIIEKQICLYQIIEYRIVFLYRLLSLSSLLLIALGFGCALYFYFYSPDIKLSLLGYFPILFGLLLLGARNLFLPYNNIKEIKILNHKISSFYSKFKSGHIEELRLKNNIDDLILHYLNNSNNIFSNYTVNKYFYKELN